MALPELIPVEDLFGLPERTGASISPDGTRIAFLAPWNDRLNIWVEDLEPGPGHRGPRRVTADETRSVGNHFWADDPRYLLYQQDTGGDENWHLFRVDLEDPQAPAMDLTPFPGARVLAVEPAPGRPGKLTLMHNARTPAELDLYELDVATGGSTMLARGTGPGTSWLPGRDGELFAIVHDDGGDIEISRRDPATGELCPVLVLPGADYPLGASPMQPTPDGAGMWVGSNRGGDRTRLVRVDLATGAETEIDSHPDLELDSTRRLVAQICSPLIRDRADGRILGVRYLGQRQVVHALDPHFAAVYANLRELSDGDLDTVSTDDSGRRWVVSFTHDRDPGATWFYDHSTGESRLLFRPHPHLDPATLAPMTPVTIPARDGLALPSYLTLPVGAEATGLPMVLLVHGGPWYRDSWGFDPTVQLLANRGHAVLQVNFRGSTGYGKAHMQAAVGEFAGAMHDDLIDAVDWAIDRGYADPDRVAIMGGSYGGYAALVGAAFTPQRFAAAVDMVGISDLANFMRTLPPFARPGLASNWFAYVGDPDDPAAEADMLARSPVGRLDDVTGPLLVAQGANDVRVVRAESDTVVEYLRARDVDVEYVVFDDEGHGFVNPENRIAFHRTLERFLARHLGGRMDDRAGPGGTDAPEARPEPDGCPVTSFGLLREQGPVVDASGLGTGSALIVTRHEDVRAMLTDPRFRCDPGSVDGAGDALGLLFEHLGLPPELDHLGRGLLTRDGADHTRLRTLVSRAFTVRRVHELRPRVESITDGLLDDIAAAASGGRTVDLVAALAYPLPIAVICELVGVPPRQRPRWAELGRLLVAPDPARMPAAAHAVVDQISELIAARRAVPADDLVTGLVRAHADDGDRLTEREMITMVFDLVTAGFETTAHLISKAVPALLTRPEQLAALRAEPALWPRAVHELVRTCGPVPTALPRYAAEDVQVGGSTVVEGSTVLAGLLCANFDPRTYDRPEELDVRRDPGRGEGHLGFGQGAHYCLGAALARQETEVALRALFERFPGLHLAGAGGTGPSQLGFLRLAELPVRTA